MKRRGFLAAIAALIAAPAAVLQARSDDAIVRDYLLERWADQGWICATSRDGYWQLERLSDGAVWSESAGDWVRPS